MFLYLASQNIHADPFDADGLDRRDVQFLLQFDDIYVDAEIFGLIEYIEYQDDGKARLQKLQRHRKHPLYIFCVYDMEDDAGGFVKQDRAADLLLFRDGQERIHARRVNDFKFLSAYSAFAPVDLNGRPGIIGDIGVAAGEIIEYYGLAYVRRADYRYFTHHFSGNIISLKWYSYNHPCLQIIGFLIYAEYGP